MGADYYFTSLLDEQKKLEDHGFDHYPTDGELAEYAFSLEDRIEALCDHIDVKLSQDVRGRWHADGRGEGTQW